MTKRPVIEKPNMSILADEWRAKGLGTQLSLFFNETSPSTMEMAQKSLNALDSNQVPDGCVVQALSGAKQSKVSRALVALAFEQTQGRGQHQRQWISTPGKGLYLTFGFRMNTESPPLQGLSMVAGIAVQRYCNSLGVKCGLKWPNDVLVNCDGAYRKLAGVLTECSSLGNNIHSLFVGIGINLYQQTFPKQIPGISLEDAGALVPSYEEACSSFVQEAMSVFRQPFARGFSSFQEEYNRNSLLTGARVVDTQGRRLVAVSVAADGALMVREQAGGELERVISGEITLLDNLDH